MDIFCPKGTDDRTKKLVHITSAPSFLYLFTA